jgi:hypothetical protein
VDGGGNIDTLKLNGSGSTLDLTILANPEAFTESTSLPNTLRILVLVEASNTSLRLSIMLRFGFNKVLGLFCKKGIKPVALVLCIDVENIGAGRGI